MLVVLFWSRMPEASAEDTPSRMLTSAQRSGSAGANRQEPPDTSNGNSNQFRPARILPQIVDDPDLRPASHAS